MYYLYIYLIGPSFDWSPLKDFLKLWTCFLHREITPSLLTANEEMISEDEDEQMESQHSPTEPIGNLYMYLKNIVKRMNNEGINVPKEWIPCIELPKKHTFTTMNTLTCKILTASPEKKTIAKVTLRLLHNCFSK